MNNLMQTFTAKAKKSLSWSFNNNGNKICPKRIRIEDGSPIHSTGLDRLSTHWEYALAAVLSIPQDQPLWGLIVTIAALKLNKLPYQITVKNIFDTDKLCINTKPDNKTKPTSKINLANSQTLSKAAKLNTAAPAILTAACIPFDPKTAIALLPWATAITIHNIRNFNRFNNVAKENWVIEDMVAPQKNEEAEASKPTLAAPIPKAI